MESLEISCRVSVLVIEHENEFFDNALGSIAILKSLCRRSRAGKRNAQIAGLVKLNNVTD